MKKSSIFINLFLNTIYEILLIFCPLITAPYISRVLLSNGVGVYSYTSSLVSYFLMFAALGTYTYATREVSINRNDKVKLSKLFWEIEVLTGITSFIALVSWSLLSYYYVEYKSLLFLYGLQIIACFFDISWLYAGLEKFKYTILLNSLIKIISVIMCFVLVKKADDVNIYIFIQSAAILLGNLSMWMFLPKFLCKCRIEFKSVFLHFKNTLVYFVPTIAATLYTMIDKTLIGLITSDNSENGFYEQATKIISIVKSTFIISIVNVICPRMSYLFKNKEKNKIQLITHSTLNLILALCIGSFFGIIGVAENFVELFFGSGYDKTVDILYFLSPIVIALGFTKTLGSLYFIPSGKINKSSKILIIGAVTNLVLNIALIPQFKSIGAAIASVISEFVIAILYFYNCEKIVCFKDIIKMIYKKIIAGLVMLVIILLLNELPIDNSIIRLVVSVLLGLIIYFMILFIMKDDSITIGINLIKERRKK